MRGKETVAQFLSCEDEGAVQVFHNSLLWMVKVETILEIRKPSSKLCSLGNREGAFLSQHRTDQDLWKRFMPKNASVGKPSWKGASPSYGGKSRRGTITGWEQGVPGEGGQLH